MKLDQAQTQKLLSWLNSKWKEPRKCQICGDNNWNIVDYIFELREHADGAMSIGGPVLPVVTMNCVNCGNTLHLNAIRIGLLEKKAGEVNK